jgi:N-dimethylarginine dimethylaminohydrolase
MREQKFTKLEMNVYMRDAMLMDYNHLLVVSMEMVDKCNERYELNRKGLLR